jgi:hypothetical protein
MNADKYASASALVSGWGPAVTGAVVVDDLDKSNKVDAIWRILEV